LRGVPRAYGVCNIGLDDPGPSRPDSHCNFGDVALVGQVQELTISSPWALAPWSLAPFWDHADVFKYLD
jgi:hypothetical protein